MSNFHRLRRQENTQRMIKQKLFETKKSFNKFCLFTLVWSNGMFYCRFNGHFLWMNRHQCVLILRK